MRVYQAIIERYQGDSWIVELPVQNWGILHTEADGGRATLETKIRSVVEELTGEKEFYVALSVAGGQG